MDRADTQGNAERRGEYLAMSPDVLLAVGVGTMFLAFAHVARARRRHRKSVTDRDRKIETLHSELQQLRRRLVVDLETDLGDVTQLEADWNRLAAASRLGADPFSLVLVRVDDTHCPGRPLPLTVVRGVAVTLFETARTEDHLYRLDEHTFGGLLTACTAAGARAFVQRCRRAIAATNFNEGDAIVRLELRVGVAEWSKDSDSFDSSMAAVETDAAITHGLDGRTGSSETVAEAA